MYLRTSASLPVILLTVVPLLITYFGWIDQNFFTPELPQETKEEGYYDFVVVGGGSAGCVVSARLSENPLHQVLLLEAGGNPSPFSIVPAALPYLQNHATTDWQYKTTAQNNAAFGSPNQLVTWPRGKGLGGSSTTNFMMYMRGNRKDFEEWATITGDSRWSYESAEKYFKKMEDYRGFHKNTKDYHGTDGPLRIEPVRYSPGLDNYLEAVTESGFKVRDLNADQQEGFSPLDYTQKRGRRFSTYSAYIKPNLGRKNLKILTYSHVTKVHLDSDLKAIGVSYVRKGRTEYVAAKKEVVISGGAINSPQLLMLSGIGPFEHLKSVGVEPLVDLPVGRNLLEHVGTAIGPFTLNQKVSFMPTRDVSLSSLTDFAFNGSGPLTSPIGTISIGVTSTSTSPGWPNLLHVISAVGVYDGFGATLDLVFGSGTYMTKLLAPFIDYDSHLAVMALGKPKSVGFIELLDKNPFSKPLINPRYYSDDGNEDIENMIEGYEWVVNLYENSTALGKKLGAKLIEIPDCSSKFQPRSRAYFECAIRTLTFTTFHPVGTCSMGKVGDSRTVVDSQLRVIGTKGLRVIDASVMATITNANTNAPTIMIAELGSDLIKMSHS